MKLYKSLGALALATSVLFITSCEEKDDTVPTDPTPKTGEFTIEFDHMFDGKPFNLNTVYQNGSGEDVEFSLVKYYISNIKLEKMDGTVWEEENSYHLMDASNSASALLKLTNVPAAEYHKLTYTIGVDSARNVSGA